MAEALIARKLNGKRFAPLLAEGAFYMANRAEGAAFTEAPVRIVSEDHGATVLAFEKRERRNGVDFAPGQTLIAAAALYLWERAGFRSREGGPCPPLDKAYGSRAGQSYPLWNWCVHFSGNFTIADDATNAK